MGDLPLKSLYVQGFRAFDDLRLDQLQRANLIVGRNNVGKTYLLEAIRLFVYNGAPDLLRTMLIDRDESPEQNPQPAAIEEVRDWVLSFENLFHGRQTFGSGVEPIRMDVDGSVARRLVIDLDFYVERRGEDGVRQLELLVDPPPEAQLGEELRPALVIKSGGGPMTLIALDQFDDRPSSWRWRGRDGVFSPAVPCLFVTSGGPDALATSQLWDRVTLTELEQEVTDALQLVEPRIERVTLVGDVRRPRGRTVLVKLQGEHRRVTLRSMGEGINRLFGLVLALVNVKGGVLLVDEIENGFHYTVLPDLWRLILKTARQLNIQVFATTHSWDCIEAFQTAIRDDVEDDATLIRLESRQEGIRSVSFNKSELSIVTREQIEVR